MRGGQKNITKKGNIVQVWKMALVDVYHTRRFMRGVRRCPSDTSHHFAFRSADVRAGTCYWLHAPCPPSGSKGLVTRLGLIYAGAMAIRWGVITNIVHQRMNRILYFLAKRWCQFLVSASFALPRLEGCVTMNQTAVRCCPNWYRLRGAFCKKGIKPQNAEGY